MAQFLPIIFILLLLDIYVFQAIKTVTAELGPMAKNSIYVAYWLLSAITLGFLLFIPYIRNQVTSPFLRLYPLAIMLGIIIAKILSVSFFLMDDIRRLVQWIYVMWQSKRGDAEVVTAVENGISRSVFLSWLGLGFGGSIFATMLYGFKNQYNYKVRNIRLAFSNLPTSFKGLRIVQISDIHSGSFINAAEVQKGVDIINNLRPDIILFTGDLVNDRAEEMEPFIEIFSQLNAPMGVYSTLGNHDYGDYVPWESAGKKAENLEKLKQTHADMGWRLLMDESVSIDRNGASIGLIGVQNTSGKSSFHSYGNIEKAYAGAAGLPFKILMSHDPSHWDAEVLKHYPDIDLTLSGHTHGMQFGVELPWFKWSPVQWMYRQWAGLYETGHQKLYVNRGFGFIGYPGRVGILPEISLIELI